MKNLDAAIRIRSLRAQLDVLEARLRFAAQPPRHTLGDLRGMLQGDVQSTDEEINDVKYRGEMQHDGGDLKNREGGDINFAQ